jgi:hypothetical protein
MAASFAPIEIIRCVIAHHHHRETVSAFAYHAHCWGHDLTPAVSHCRRIEQIPQGAADGEVFDLLVQSGRNKRAALKLMCKLMTKYAFVPD